MNIEETNLQQPMETITNPQLETDTALIEESQSIIPLIEEQISADITVENLADVIEVQISEDKSDVELNQITPATVPEVQDENISIPESTKVEEPIFDSELKVEVLPLEEKTEKASSLTEEIASPDSELKAEETATDENADFRLARQQHFEKVFNTLKEMKENNSSIKVYVKSRIRGGLRVIYNEMPLFLPTSHFSLRRTPSEEEMQSVVGKTIEVVVHELQEIGETRRTVIVSRKKLLLEDFWNKLKVGDIVEGRVASIAKFGVFVDIGGVEGLIHVSRLSQKHIPDPSKVFARGDKLNAVVVEIDRERNRIALSRRELEESPWKNVEQEFPSGTQHNGIVRRIVDFGAYVELRPGIEGILRTSELSWTKRVRKVNDLFTVGQEVPVFVINVSEKNRTLTLSFKRTQPNPWQGMIERFPIGKEFIGTITMVTQQGAIVNVADDVDGFMPRSKMKEVLRGRKIPFQPGDKLTVEVADLRPEEASLIFAPKIQEENSYRNEEPRQRRQSSSNQSMDEHKTKPNQSSQGGSFSLVDLISDSEKKSLFKTLPE